MNENKCIECKWKKKDGKNLICSNPETIPLNMKIDKTESACGYFKTSKINKEVVELLEEKEIKKQYLDLGEINGQWYYGFSLKGNDNIILDDGSIFRVYEEAYIGKNKKGKNVNKFKIINEIKELFDYGEDYIGNIAPTWNKKSISKFHQKKIKKIDKEEIFTEVRDNINFFMDFAGNKNITDVQACWTLGTYCYPLFDWFPHLLFHAPSGSGKTKNAEVVYLSSFRGYDLGGSGGLTPASIYRTLEGNRGTIFIDEYEEVKDSEVQKLTNQILNVSASRKSYIIKLDQVENKWVPKKFQIFCPKITCNISGINPTSLSRFIVFKILKTNTNKGKYKPNKPIYESTFENIRNKLHILIMQNWKEIKKIYNTLELKEIKNRDLDNWLPICAIAKFIGEDVFESVLDYINVCEEIKSDSEDVVGNLLISIYEHVEEEDKKISTKQIPLWVDDMNQWKSPDRWVGRKLKHYGFTSYRTTNERGFILSKPRLKKVLELYFSKLFEAFNDVNDVNDSTRMPRSKK